MSTRKLHIGFFKVLQIQDVPESSLVWAPPDDPGWTPEELGTRRLVAHLNPQEEHFASESAAAAYIQRCADELKRRRLAPIAFSWGEEWYLGRTKNWSIWGGLTGFALADALKARVDRAIVLMKRQWPHAYSLQIEPLYNDVKLFGPQYYAPAYACDIIALDPYMSAVGNPAWHTEGMALDANTSREKFDLEVARIYEHAAQAYLKPIMMIPQAFRHTMGGNDPWQVTPTAAQLRWWFDLAQRLPRVIAICWFARHSQQGVIDGLDRYPKLWAEVQRECREMGYAT